MIGNIIGAALVVALVAYIVAAPGLSDADRDAADREGARAVRARLGGR
jgi:hypothetical protein